MEVRLKPSYDVAVSRYEHHVVLLNRVIWFIQPVESDMAVKSGKLKNIDDPARHDLPNVTILEAAELAEFIEENWGGVSGPVALVKLVAAPRQLSANASSVHGPIEKARAPGSDDKPTRRRHILAEPEEADLSPDELTEVKRQALEILAAAALDTPECHLAYVRKALAGVG